MVGLDITSVTKDFSYNKDGRLTFVDGKERMIRNFEKFLITESGELNQIQDTDERYNPQFGTNLYNYLGEQRGSKNPLVLVKSELERICQRFIDNQKNVIENLDEDEYICKYVTFTKWDTSRAKILFQIMLWTFKDVREGKNPSYNKAFSVSV